MDEMKMILSELSVTDQMAETEVPVAHTKRKIAVGNGLQLGDGCIFSFCLLLVFIETAARNQNHCETYSPGLYKERDSGKSGNTG